MGDKARKPKYPFEKFQKEVVEMWGSNFTLAQAEPYKGIKSLGVLTCQKHGKSWTLPIETLRKKGKNLCCECCKTTETKTKITKKTDFDSFKTETESTDFAILKAYKEACASGNNEEKRRLITIMMDKFDRLILKHYNYWKTELEVKNGGWEKTDLDDYKSFAVLKLISAMDTVKFEKIKDPSKYGFHVQLDHYLQSYTDLALKHTKRKYVEERPLFKTSPNDPSLQVCQLDLENARKAESGEYTAGVEDSTITFNRNLFWEAVQESNLEFNKIQKGIWLGKQKNLKTKEICEQLNINPYTYTLNLKVVKEVFKKNLDKKGLSVRDFC